MANLRFDRFDNGNPAENDMKAKSPSVPTSAFDFSMTHCGNTLIGLFAPIDCFDVVPREKIQMSATALLEFRNPTTRQIMNGFRVYFHSRYMRLDHIWEGAHNFIDKGRSGNIDLTQPNLIWHSTHQTSGRIVKWANANTPMSLLNFLGLPAEYLQTQYGTSSGNPVTPRPLMSFRAAISDNSSNPASGTDYKAIKLSEQTDFFPAAPCFMYQKVWRDHYCNKNLLQKNKYWFPDNEDHFILSYSCQNACAIVYEDEDLANLASAASLPDKESAQMDNITGNTLYEQFTPYPNNIPTNTVPVSPSDVIYYSPNLSAIKFVQFRGDRFTTANPFPDLIRGDIPALSNNQQLNVNVLGSHSPDQQFNIYSGVNVSSDHANLYAGQSLPDRLPLYVDNPLAAVDMSAFYTLETITAFKRKLGMTNGDYNEAIKAQYGESAHAYERNDEYIGGFYQDFSISAVTQSSESASTPLGTKAGQGVSAGSGNLGFIDVPDFGWIQTYMFIVPDVYYTQGKPRQYSKKTFVDMYFPLFNNLPAQEIRRDELYISGNQTTDSSPFAYEDRYSEYKSRTNRVSGFMGLSHSVAAYDASRIMARRFRSNPTFNNNFVTLVPENTDMEVFTVVTEPPFDFQVAINVRRVSPMPYMAIEGSLSSPALNA